MKSIKQILKNNKHVWFFVEDEDKKDFLKFAKENNCKWINGEEIDVENHNCGHFMGITNDLKMGFISSQCWIIKGRNAAKKILFKEIKGEAYEQSCN